MQVYRNTPFPHPPASYNMFLSHEQRLEHQYKHQQQQHHQYSQLPYNPYPHQKYPQEPQYTLRDEALAAPEFTTPSSTMNTRTGTTTATTTTEHPSASTADAPSSTTAPSSSGGTAPTPEMFFELERLLMGITPFPPSIPTIAKPTCPSMDDQSMAELSSPSSSPSSTSSSVPSLILNEQSMDVLKEFYQNQQHNRPSRISKHYQSNTSYHQHQQQQRSAADNCSTGSMTPPHSPYSYASSSSPTLPFDNSTDLPYWSPSTPNMQVEPHWSNHSSPLIQQQQSPPQPQPSHPQQQQQPGTSWGSLFDPLNSMSDLGRYIAPADSQFSQEQPSHRSSSASLQHQTAKPSAYSYYSSTSPLPSAKTMASSLAAKRAARTHQRNLNLPGGVREYESNAREHHSYMYYSQPSAHQHHPRSMTTQSTSAPSSSSSQSTSGSQQPSSYRSDNNHSNWTSGSSSGSGGNSGRTASNGGSSSSSSSSSGNGNNNNNNNNSRVKSYPCPTCTKPFPTRTQLKSHMAIHVDHFPFPCLYSGCDLHFKRKHDLRRHVDAKHALIKKYLCSGGCGEGFGRRDQMMRHLRRGTCGHSFSQVQTTTTNSM
ncbi:hypothetical protein EMPS_08032 [Entomortierella parvispora]|uniref:C2H2-type domain-containing protein n=1 Tax=Entomortierella parvispora TaxID=205924 RepID=A0A9P3HFD6_9FUNG|nr:hypothetical protein EMPS_08032 [Entomortierella parvispora]